MDWHKYLREERSRKLVHIALLRSGQIKISRTTLGDAAPLNDEMIADYERHIAEIEKILTDAGEPFDT